MKLHRQWRERARRDRLERPRRDAELQRLIARMRALSARAGLAADDLSMQAKYLKAIEILRHGK